MVASILIALGLLTTVPLTLVEGAELKETLITEFSCRDQCDGDKMFPCSCSAMCLVYHNCCQDFERECPVLVKAGENIFPNLLNSGAICAQEEAYFMIASCPSGADKIVEEVSTSQSVAVTIDNHTTEAFRDNIHATTTGSAGPQDLGVPGSRSGSYSTLLTQLESVPVTDKKTGIVFTNLKIFRCHADEQSQPVFWKAVVQLISPEQPESFEHLTTLTNINNALHIAPVEVTSALAMCIPVSIGKCRDDLAHNNLELESRCGAYKSYVTLKSSAKVYDNLDCLQCNGINPNVTLWEPYAKAQPPRGQPMFSVTFDVRSNVVKLSAIESHEGGRHIPWSTATCTLPGRGVLETANISSSCVIEECAGDAVKRADGRCGVLHQLHFAVAYDHPLTSIEQRRLPQFAQCFMKDYLSYDVPKQTTPISAVGQYDVATGQTIYVTKLLIYLPIIAVQTSATKNRLLREVDTMSKIFKNYRKGEESDNYFQTTDDSDDTHVRILPSSTKNIEDIFRGENVTANETTTSCAEVDAVDRYEGMTPIFKDINMICWSSPVYEKDEAALEAFRASSCVEVFGSVASSCWLPQVMMLSLGTGVLLLLQALC